MPRRSSRPLEALSGGGGSPGAPSSRPCRRVTGRPVSAEEGSNAGVFSYAQDCRVTQDFPAWVTEAGHYSFLSGARSRDRLGERHAQAQHAGRPGCPPGGLPAPRSPPPPELGPHSPPVCGIHSEISSWTRDAQRVCLLHSDFYHPRAPTEACHHLMDTGHWTLEAAAKGPGRIPSPP